MGCGGSFTFMEYHLRVCDGPFRGMSGVEIQMANTLVAKTPKGTGLTLAQKQEAAARTIRGTPDGPLPDKPIHKKHGAKDKNKRKGLKQRG
jgi:hypothetical protein